MKSLEEDTGGAPATTALELAVGRNLLAADRTLLAWIRTSAALIGFGFSIYKVLDSLVRAGLAATPRPDGPRNLGLALVATGTASLLVATFAYWRYIRLLRRERPFSLWKVTIATAVTVALVGVFVLVSILSRMDFF